MTDEQIRRKLLREKRRKKARRRRIIISVIMALAILDGALVGAKVGGTLPKPVKKAPARQEASKEIVSVAARDIPIVDTAVSQIGNKGGEPYWSWYGFGSRVAWCACFVSWAENECGMLDSGAAPKFALVSEGSDWFKNRGRWLKAGSKPKAGDLIFFDWEQDGGRDHVGVVTAVVGDVIFSVEGNSSDRCRMKRYYVDDPVIYGYGQIAQ